MGHGFVLAMLIEGVVKVDESGNVTYADGLMDDPHKSYSPDLRKLTDEQKLERAASCAGVTVDELQLLSDGDRKLLKRAYSREACKARGIARAAWERLPLSFTGTGHPISYRDLSRRWKFRPHCLTPHPRVRFFLTPERSKMANGCYQKKSHPPVRGLISRGCF